MDGWLKQSIAITLRIGPFLDSIDGNTQETALTIAQADVVLSKAGGLFAAKSDVTSCTHDSRGNYACPLDATDTGTLGMLKLHAHVAGALAVWHTFMVVPAQAWDSLFGADKLDVAVVEQANIDFGALQKASLNAATPASVTGNVGGNVVGSVASVTADVGITQAGADKVWTSATRTLTSFGTLIADIWAYSTRTLTAFSTALALSVWDVLETAIATASSIGLKLKTNLDAAITTRSSHAPVDIWSVTTRALTDKAGFTISGTKTTLDILNDITAASVWVSTTRTLTSLGSALVAEIWNALTSGMTTAGSIGKKLADWVVGTIDTYIGNIKQTGDSFARLGAPAGASVSADIAAIKNDTAAILDDTGTSGVIVNATGLAADAVDEILDEVVEGTLTLRQAIRLLLAGMAGKSTGGGTTTLTFRDVADLKARITATVDANGNRTAITRDGT